jgi:hypothetical protein
LEFQTFATFFKTTLSDGVLPFNLPLAGVGDGLVDVEVFFSGAEYNATPGGGLVWDVSATLTSHKPPIWDERALDRYFFDWRALVLSGGENALLEDASPVLLKS